MNKKIKFYFIIPMVLIVVVLIVMKIRAKPESGEVTKEVKPVIGSVQSFISTTGTVLPKNRLEIKPPVNGRVDSILVQEGDKVKPGQILAWMSSTERAALLDAAEGQGMEQLKYWKEVYKPIALLASIEGEVIVATTQPGQTVTTSDAVIVLSDKLIVRAQVDETDIGKVRVGQEATVSLDAYPDSSIKAKVEHMYYESKTVNNVTIYEVDLIPEQVPGFFRSGMNATINFIIHGKEGAILVPNEAIKRDKEGDYCMVKRGQEEVKASVTIGLSDEKNTEVLTGINKDDTVIIKTKKFAIPKDDLGSNPFTPFGKKKNQ